MPPATGGPAFPCRQAFVQRDTEGFGPRWRGLPLPAPDAGRRSGVCRRHYERLYPAQVWDPHAPLGWLLGVEPPDPRFNKVVGDLCPGGDERLELPHKDFRCCGVWQGDHCEEPVRIDVTEVFQEGCHQLPRGCGSVDAVERSQFPLCCGGRGGGGGMATQSWTSAALAGEGCREVVPGCPPGTYSVEGSCCWGTEQGVAAGGGPADS